MKKLIPWIVGVVVLLLVGSWLYSAPYRTLTRMQTAVEKRNAAAFNAYIDYPSVRASLKSELGLQLSQQAPDNSLEGAAQAALGSTLIDGMINSLVAPETVEKALETPPTPAAKSTKRLDPLPVPSKDPSFDPHNMLETLEKDVTFESGYRNLDTFDITMKHKAMPGEFVVVLKRSGLTQWKVSEIQLPDMVKMAR